MSATPKLSLTSAVFINLNIMIGAGIFINAANLWNYAGMLSFAVYAVVGALLLPMILCIAHLVSIHPSGGFLTYGQKEISPLAGFISAWSYFIGKLGSATLLIHTSLLLLKQIIPLLAPFNIFVLDALLLGLFIGLNMFNLKTGQIIQAWILAFKLIPIFFVIGAGLILWQPQEVIVNWNEVIGIGSCIPLVLYAFLGFEATCSLSDNIQDAQKNGPRAIRISYACVVALYMLYQLMISTSLGSLLESFGSFLPIFPALLYKIASPNSIHLLQRLLNCAVAASALGGSYGILLSNCWNLHALATLNYVPFWHKLKQLNRHAIPFLCVITEGFICLLYLFVSNGNPITLQLTSVAGSITAYTISVVALFYATTNPTHNISFSRIVMMSGLGSCILLIGFCLRNIILFTPWRMIGFVSLLVGGIIYFLLRAYPKIK